MSARQRSLRPHSRTKPHPAASDGEGAGLSSCNGHGCVFKGARACVVCVCALAISRQPREEGLLTPSLRVRCRIAFDHGVA